MNNLWNRSVGPFDEAAAQRHRHMGLLDCNGDVNADAVNFLAHLCAGLFFDALCDSYVEMQTVSRICQAFCKSENVEAQRVVLNDCLASIREDVHLSNAETSAGKEMFKVFLSLCQDYGIIEGFDCDKVDSVFDHLENHSEALTE